MLWDIIFDFFVHYVFGGVDTNGEWVDTFIGHYGFYNNGQWDSGEYYCNDIYLGRFAQLDGIDYAPTFGTYFSLIATIISMVVIVILCCLLIKKIYNICAHIIG